MESQAHLIEDERQVKIVICCLDPSPFSFKENVDLLTFAANCMDKQPLLPSSNATPPSMTVRIDRQMPFLLTLTPSPLSDQTDVLLHYLPPGRTEVGTEGYTGQFIALPNAVGVAEQHCFFHVENNCLTVHPYEGRQVEVDGEMVEQPQRIQKGAVIKLGNYTFKYFSGLDEKTPDISLEDPSLLQTKIALLEKVSNNLLQRLRTAEEQKRFYEESAAADKAQVEQFLTDLRSKEQLLNSLALERTGDIQHLHDLCAAQDAHIVELQAQLDALRSGEAEQQVSDLHSLLASSEHTCSNLEADLLACRAKCSELQSQVETQEHRIRDLEDSLGKHIEENYSIQREISRLHADTRSKQRDPEVSSLSASSSDETDSGASSTSHKRKKSSAPRGAIDLASLSSLGDKTEALQTLVAALEQLQNEIEDVRHTLGEKDLTITQLTHRLEQQIGLYEELRQENQRLKDINTQTKVHSYKMKAELDRARDQLQESFAGTRHTYTPNPLSTPSSSVAASPVLHHLPAAPRPAVDLVFTPPQTPAVPVAPAVPAAPIPPPEAVRFDDALARVKSKKVTKSTPQPTRRAATTATPPSAVRSRGGFERDRLPGPRPVAPLPTARAAVVSATPVAATNTVRLVHERSATPTPKSRQPLPRGAGEIPRPMTPPARMRTSPSPSAVRAARHRTEPQTQLF
eukprot:TRINITY_DN13804_c0_g1_i2.p1 TRINITY_DN13804_c0_g1~~TRINITY_DN13804_c0_g1_i2.p1  ORF type:complete len:686 (+),score=109.71 TRINITY_DN13804_c0_g1_i2:443-2500(+)